MDLHEVTRAGEVTGYLNIFIISKSLEVHIQGYSSYVHVCKPRGQYTHKIWTLNGVFGAKIEQYFPFTHSDRDLYYNRTVHVL